VSANYQTFVHLVRPSGLLWAQEDHLNPGGFPTKRWDTEHYVRDVYEIAVPYGTPPGDYELNVGLYLMERGIRLAVIDPAGDTSGDNLALGSIEVKRPLRQPTVRQLAMAEDITIELPECGMTLLGFTQSVSSIVTPGHVELTLFWRADSEDVSCQYRHVLLSNSADAIVFQNSGVPGGYSTGLWHRGDLIRDPVRIAVAEDAAVVGEYRISVVVDGSQEESVLPLTAVMIAHESAE